MDVNQFVRNAVRNLYPVEFTAFSKRYFLLQFNTFLDFFIHQLRQSGIKVILRDEEFFLSPKLGVLPKRLLNFPRPQVRKSMAFYRIRKQKKFTVPAVFALATFPSIQINKESMVKLQLANKCTEAVVFLNGRDVWENIEQAKIMVGSNQMFEGYFISGVNTGLYNLDNLTREINCLTVHIVSSEKIKAY